MRKTIVTALIALMIMLAFASCDNPMSAKESEDGMATVKVVTGGLADSRSLVSTAAKDNSTFMEVIFKNGSDYYYASDFIGSTISLRVKVGTYTTGGTNDAIILIGRSDGTLLATGRLNGGTANVTTGSNSIAFTAVPLSAALNADAASSAFAIVGGTAGTGFSAYTDKGSFIGDDGVCFQVKDNTANIEASLTVGGFAATGTAIKIVNVTSPVTFTEVGGTTNPITVVGSYSPGAGDPLGISGEFSFKFTSVGESYYKITFDIPVKGFDDTKTYLRTWHIKGGIKSGIDLTGDINNNAVALAVLSSPASYGTVTPTTPATW